jgi:hypothetical protein
LIDLHAHLLPGFDDGVRSLEEARALARAASVDGVTTSAATPHVRDDYPTSAVRMERGVAALRADFAEAGIGIEVVTGGEVAFERLWELGDDDVSASSRCTGRTIPIGSTSGTPTSSSCDPTPTSAPGASARSSTT